MEDATAMFGWDPRTLGGDRQPRAAALSLDRVAPASAYAMAQEGEGASALGVSVPRRDGARGTEHAACVQAHAAEGGAPSDPDHDLRHTFASLLLQQGESVVYVKEQLGHASIQITVDTYGHLISGANRGAVDRLDDAWA